MGSDQPDIFDRVRLPASLTEYLLASNPWWKGLPGKPLPKFRRWAFEKIVKSLTRGSAPATVLCGPRQVGKSTLQMQVIEHLMETREVMPDHILRVQFDELPSIRSLEHPVLSITSWFESRVLKKTLNEAARQGERVILMFDEVQNLKDWAPQVKALVDHHQVRVLATGSSALRIEVGRDSLAGRLMTIEMGPLSLREIAGLRGFGDVPTLMPSNGADRLRSKEAWVELASLGERDVRDRAFVAFSERGGYPRAHEDEREPWSDVAEQLVESVVRRVIQHDLRLGELGRKRDQRLLEEVFRLACRYAGQAPGQAVFVEDIKSELNANIGFQRIGAYLKFLDMALLVKLIAPHELRLKRRRGPSKICLCDHALRAAWLHELIPLDPAGLRQSPHLSDLSGHIAESIVGYFLTTTAGLAVSHFPERGPEPEVDYVVTLGEQRIPIEVKYQSRIDGFRDARGLRAFVEKSVYNAPFGVLVTMNDGVRVDDPRIVPMSLPSLLLLR